MGDTELRHLLGELSALRSSGEHAEVVKRLQALPEISAIRAGLRFPLIEIGAASYVALGESAAAQSLLKKLGRRTVDDYRVLACLAATFINLEQFDDAEHMCVLAREAKKSQEARRRAREVASAN